jgi:hypothetical protein
MTAYRQLSMEQHRPPSQVALVPSIMSYAMPVVDVGQVAANVAIVPLPPPLLPPPVPVQVPVELPLVHPDVHDVAIPPNGDEQEDQ